VTNKIAQPVNGQAVGATYAGDANLLSWYLALGYVYDDTSTTSKLNNTSVAPASDPQLAVNREDPWTSAGGYIGVAFSDDYQFGLDAALAARARTVYVTPGSQVRPKQLPAAGGSVVLIDGDNFTGATSVTFGGTAGTAFSVINDNTIQVTTPAKAAGSYDVVVVKGAGNATLTAGVTYV